MLLPLLELYPHTHKQMSLTPIPGARPIIITTPSPINTRTIGVLTWQPLGKNITVRQTNDIHLGHRLALHHLNGDGTWYITIERNHTHTICRHVAKKRQIAYMYVWYPIMSRPLSLFTTACPTETAMLCTLSFLSPTAPSPAVVAVSSNASCAHIWYHDDMNVALIAYAPCP